MPISKIIYKSSDQDTGTIWMDATPATATAPDIIAPKTAMLANGVLTTGTGSGGGGVTVEEKDVNFIDDVTGSIVYSYTAAEFANLSALPANPSHAGLTAQGWNWSLTDAKTYVASYGKLWIGQMYLPVDGKTLIHISIPEGTPNNRLTFSVRFTQTTSNGVIVDWGDGSPSESYTGTSAANRDHTYAHAGDYDITFDVVAGTVSFVGQSYSSAIYGNITSQQGYLSRSFIKYVFIGDKVTSIGTYAFQCCYSLKSVTIPSTVTSIDTYAFYYCYSLKSVTIPSGITNIPNYVFQYSQFLHYVSIPPTVTTFGTNVFDRCFMLQSISMPHGITTVNPNQFSYCYTLREHIIPSTVTTIGGQAYYYNYAMTNITIPSNVTNIGNSAFGSCYGMAEYHVKPTTVPTLGTSAFSNIASDCVIYVPYSADHSILEAYQTATNWSTYASYMQEEPQ